MRLSYFCLILFFALIFSCRKKEVKDVITSEEYFASNCLHCSNGYMDSTELGDDCGGECLPCEQTAQCGGYSENTVHLIYEGSRLEVAKDTLIVNADTINYIAFTNENESEYLSITFLDKPNLTTYYTGVSDFSLLDSTHVILKLVQDIYPNPMFGKGNMKINWQGGNYIFFSCDMTFCDALFSNSCTKLAFEVAFSY